jgi:hypothetical protein
MRRNGLALIEDLRMQPTIQCLNAGEDERAPTALPSMRCCTPHHTRAAQKWISHAKTCARDAGR